MKHWSARTENLFRVLDIWKTKSENQEKLYMNSHCHKWMFIGTRQKPLKSDDAY